MTPPERAEFAFKQVFGDKPEYFFFAPGRVNLIGEHTDYNDGFVLPAAINFQTVVAANRRQDQTVRCVAADYDNELDVFSLDEPVVVLESPRWANYVRGVVSSLQTRGYKIGGVDIAISGDIPQGSGLSSSAALEVAIGQTFQSLFRLTISQSDIALVGQEAEHTFVGSLCGIMDQLVSARAKQGHALLIDCRTLESTPIPIPNELAILIVDSNVSRGLVDSEYNSRRQQCEDAARLLGLDALRDISLPEFKKRINELPADIAKRARHVVTENERTLAAADALACSNMKLLSRLMAQSHESMRQDFEITIPAIDLIVNTISRVIGERGGVRMTGGGFGGCVVALLSPQLIPEVTNALSSVYERETGLQYSHYVCTASAGSGKLAQAS
ncbi:MAG: galactokinase [bacterium]